MASVLQITLAGAALSSYLAMGGQPGTFTSLPQVSATPSIASPASTAMAAITTKSPATDATTDTSMAIPSATSSLPTASFIPDPIVSSATPTAATSTQSGHVNVAMIAGIVTAAVVLLIILSLGIIVCKRRKRQRTEDAAFEKMPKDDTLPWEKDAHDKAASVLPQFEFGELRMTPSPTPSHRGEAMNTVDAPLRDADDLPEFPQPPKMPLRVNTRPPVIPQLPPISQLSPIMGSYSTTAMAEAPPIVIPTAETLGLSIDPRRDEKVSSLRQDMFRKVSRSNSLGRKRSMENPFVHPAEGMERGQMRSRAKPRAAPRPPMVPPMYMVNRQAPRGVAQTMASPRRPNMPPRQAISPPQAVAISPPSRRRRPPPLPNLRIPSAPRAKRAYRRDMDMENEWSESVTERSSSDKSISSSILETDEHALTPRLDVNPFETTPERETNQHGSARNADYSSPTMAVMGLFDDGRKSFISSDEEHSAPR